ncbi:MAG: hypothetical protein WBD54_00005, partial [Candidatus Acidiferrales bacterium]
MQVRLASFTKRQSHRWMRFGSILIGLTGLGLLSTAFTARFYTGSFSWMLLILVLMALAIAIGLHVRFLILARKEQHETASALDATELEYKSVFDNALDGIVVFDNHGICLEANPA